MCGQSDPKITRSGPTSFSSSCTSSSQNGFTQTWRRNVSVGGSGNHPAIFRAVTSRRCSSPARNPDPFSTEATRTFGNRWNSWSQIRLARKSSIGRSSCSILIGCGTPAKFVVKPSRA